MGGFAIVLGFEQKLSTRAAFGDRTRDSELVQFRSRDFRFETIGKVEVEIAEGARRLLIFAGCLVGAADGEFDIAADGGTIFFKQSRCLGGAAFLEQRVGINQVGIPDQKRVGKVLDDIGERGKRLGIVTGLQVGVAEVVGDVVSQFAGSGLGPVEGVDRFGVVVIKCASVADDQPG